jgi:tRNA pseudouridine55 synthase
MDKTSGILLINKPKGITSFQVIRILRKNTGVQKIGHAGTLDKNATGLLVLGVGNGTKRLSEMLNMDKTYLFRIQFGVESETGDQLGINWSYQQADPWLVNEENIKKVIRERFSGEIWQTPPVYSALKKDGVRFSDLARSNVQIVPEPRKITIHQCELLHFSYDSYQPVAIIRLSCSHGTYIRSVCRDFGILLGTKAIMTNLFRIQVGSYHVGEAYPLASINSRDVLERGCRC